MDAEQLSFSAFLVGVTLTAVASAAYLAAPLWPRVSYAGAAAGVGSSITVTARGGPPAWLTSAASAATWLAVAALTASLAGRWVASGHPPYANMWEFTVGFGWAILASYALFEWRFRARDAEQTAGVFVLPVALALFIIALLFFPSGVQPLVPALQSNRILGAHVASMMLSYAVLSVSFGAAALYLVQGGGRRRRFARLPDSESLDEIGHRAVLVGFPLLTLGLALGAFWAHQAWSRYWGWDPKETSALIIWLVYGGYLHARNLRGWRGRPAAWLLIGGFVAMMFSYFVVNLWVDGLHSYAGV